MMRVALAVSLALLSAGCGGTDYYVRYASTATPATGVVSSGSTVYVQGSSTSSASTFGAVIAILTLGHLLSGGDPALQSPGSSYWSSPSMAGGARYPMPELDPSRRVIEQDCTKPIEDWSANLRCK